MHVKKWSQLTNKCRTPRRLTRLRKSCARWGVLCAPGVEKRVDHLCAAILWSHPLPLCGLVALVRTVLHRWCSWNRSDSHSWLISWTSDVRISLLPMSRLAFSLSFTQFLLSHSLSLWTAKSPFRSRILGRSILSNECTTFWSRCLSPFDCEQKIVETTHYLSKFAPVSWMPLRLPTDSWSRHCFQRLLPKDPNIVRSLLAAVCLLLLDAPECRNYSGSSVVEIVASSRRGKLRWPSQTLVGVCSSFM